MNPARDFLAADWPAPAHIRAGTTRRTGGVSEPPYDALNLGAHTGDDSAAVAQNRARLCSALDLPAEPVWLTQVHGKTVADLDAGHAGPADAAIAGRPDRVAAVLTADCLPVVLCDRRGGCWGAVHAGWRGLAAGVLEATVAALPAGPVDLMAWMGPAIGADRFEVGRDVLDAFAAADPDCTHLFAPAEKTGKYHADIYALARRRLQAAGVANVHGGGYCTVTDRARFYSYRRDGSTGRMATLIWSAR
ncbi:peptidoglycan editing factor PgeF [Salinisphaera sp.]|uniref:peptidoglycan editing factor PgeF n=1 Tax=Salinisphaera sp. TaxID=1914330 RepID=UPI002D779E17|nr:peptidoglycan editing factor PgeF [Salinisphaera sp.]HET7313184.1 peptidoglycan editing factor PgeF [Salinisphaera sp.]